MIGKNLLDIYEWIVLLDSCFDNVHSHAVETQTQRLVSKKKSKIKCQFTNGKNSKVNIEMLKAVKHLHAP